MNIKEWYAKIPAKTKNYIRLMVVTFMQGSLAGWAVTGFTVDTFDYRIALGGGVAALASLIYNTLRTTE